MERPDYEVIKQWAEELNVVATSLLAQHHNSDPFYAGVARRRTAGEWFAEMYGRHGFRPGVHLRGIHYHLVVQPQPERLPDGSPYENTDDCWNKLATASANARYLGLVSPDAFVDHRAPPARIMASSRGPWDRPEPEWSVDSGNWSLPSIQPSLSGDIWSPADQPYHLEVWIEKSTMDDVLQPVCQQLGMNLVVGVGYLSITAVTKMLRRVTAADKPARIFYISDFDGSGEGMPIAVARQCEFWLSEYAPGADIKLTPIALTVEQVRHYNLPRAPIKDSDKTKQRFEDRHGEGATELDALQALYPGELERILREAAEPYIDTTLSRRLREAREEAQEAVEAAWEDATTEECDELDTIEAEAREIISQYTDRLTALSQELDADLRPLHDRLSEVRQAVQAVLAKCDTLEGEIPERPEPEIDPPDEESWLYASDRDYLTQIDYYHGQRGRTLVQRGQRHYVLTCPGCKEPFEAKRSDAITCSLRCRRRIARQGKKGA